MSDRLNELQRQRAIIQGHLAWLDSEIAAAQGSIPTALPSLASFQPQAPTPPVPSTIATPAAPYQDADELIAKFGTDTKSSAQSARRGCFLVFALSLLLLGLIVYGLYRYSRSLHENTEGPESKTMPASPAKR